MADFEFVYKMLDEATDTFIKTINKLLKEQTFTLFQIHWVENPYRISFQ
jgi:hypothetical protein